MPAALNLPPRICAICETEFQPAHRRQKYCQKKCLWKSKNTASKARHPEHMLALARASYKKHREKRVVYMRERYLRRRDEFREKAQKGFQESRLNTPWRTLITSAKGRAKEKGLDFDLTEDWAKALWTGKCAVSGLDFVLGTRGSGPHIWSPTIDRIVPKLGYIQSNCRFILQAVNAMKGALTDEDMLKVARAIVERNPL